MMSSGGCNPSTQQRTTVPIVGVAVNASLAVLKILTGVFGDSFALIADGIEFTSDIVTSLVVWGRLRVAITPADDKHPYGYGKAEPLAGIVDAMALLGGLARSEPW
jgi:divalent metal cation (Fe/Co/Zn/Cd) transporter